MAHIFSELADMLAKNPSIDVADLFESVVARDKKADLGQFFTPPALADILIEYGIRNDSDHVLEPTCGCASISSRFPVSVSAVCVDNDPNVADICKVAMRKHNAEYVDSDILLYNRIGFDAVIANFPFVNRTKTDRKQTQAGDVWKKYVQIIQGDLLQQGTLVKNLSSKTDLSIMCAIHCAKLINETGRMAVITSGGWITTDYGIIFKRFLLNRFKVDYICESAVEHWFPKTQVNATILCAEREDDPEKRKNNNVAFVKMKKSIKGINPLWPVVEQIKSVKSKTMQVHNLDFAEIVIYPQGRLQEW